MDFLQYKVFISSEKLKFSVTGWYWLYYLANMFIKILIYRQLIILAIFSMRIFNGWGRQNFFLGF